MHTILQPITRRDTLPSTLSRHSACEDTWAKASATYTISCIADSGFLRTRRAIQCHRCRDRSPKSTTVSHYCRHGGVLLSSGTVTFTSPERRKKSLQESVASTTRVHISLASREICRAPATLGGFSHNVTVSSVAARAVATHAVHCRVHALPRSSRGRKKSAELWCTPKGRRSQG